MIELFQITNNPALARRCDALPGMRLFVDLETVGKAQRQAGRNTFISDHQVADVGRVKAQLQQALLMVRVNPLHAATASELDAVLAQGADLLMLPMFHTPDELHAFSALVAGRAPIVALLETAGALQSLSEWITTPGLYEVFVGLNDLHVALGCLFMFEPLAQGLLEPVAAQARAHGLRFGFGGIARLDEGLLPGRDVLAEHVRLGSQAVILSRTFHRGQASESVDSDIAALRHTEEVLAHRTPDQVGIDHRRISANIFAIAQAMGLQQSSVT